MIIIKYMFLDEEHYLHFEDSEKANKAWKALNEDPLCSLIFGMTDDKIVVFPTTCFAVSVKFNDSKKLYTYGCHTYLKRGTQAIVCVNGFYKIVDVVESRKVEKSALKSLCNNMTPKWIHGKAIMFTRKR